MSATEEGKRQVEEAKKASDSRAKSAEADSANKSTQLAGVNAQLNSANAQLANVTRCVNKFNSLKPTIVAYQFANTEENRYWNLADSNYVDNYGLYTYYLGLSNQQTTIVNNLWTQINTAFNSISSGNCY